MVKHKNDHGNYSPLNYKHRPHSEYRTIVHVTVQLLRPRLDVADHTRWQQVADIFNHIFSDDIDEQNVRRQGHTYWRDQYVHHNAAGRPKEWKEVLKPDEELTTEERQRRFGYRNRIRQAARDLGIAVSNPQSAFAPSEATTSHPEPKRRRSRAAVVDANDPVEEGDDVQPQLDGTGSGEGKKTKTHRKQSFHGKQGREKLGRIANASKLTKMPSAEDTFERPKPERVRSTNAGKVEMEEDDEDDEESDGRKCVKRNMNRYYEKDEEIPKWKLGGYSAELNAMGVSVPSRTQDKTARGQTSESLAADEAYAGSLHQEDDGSRRTGRSGKSNMSDSLQGSGNDRPMPVASTRGKRQRSSSFKLQPASRWTTNQDSKLRGIEEKTENKRAAAGDTSQRTTSKASFEKDKTVPEKGKTVWRKSGKLTTRPVARLSTVAVKPKTTASTSNANETTDGERATFPESSEISDMPEDTKSLTRKSIGLSRGTAPPLTMIHGRGSETRWFDGVPYARKTAKRKNAPLTPAIVLPTSPMAKRCGMVVRGVLDGREEDVMLCVPNECGWCNSASNNSTLGLASRKAFGQPLVHSCCVQYDEEYDVYEFVPVEGIGQHWEKKLPEDVVEMKMQFNDYMTRGVYVCVREKCDTCKDIEE